MNRYATRWPVLGFATLVLMAVAVSCTTSLAKCNPALPEQLAVAWQEQDSAATPLVRQVLEDSVRKGYCYDMAARDDAFDLIQDLRSVELVHLLREVAAMDYRTQRDFKQTWDLISIQRALMILTNFRDESAIELNRRRLRSDTWLQSVAVDNLLELKFWDATAEIAGLLRIVKPDEEHLLLISKIVRFLAGSPKTTVAICPQLAIISSTYDNCFTELDAASQCQDLVPSIRALDARLGCEAAPE